MGSYPSWVMARTIRRLGVPLLLGASAVGAVVACSDDSAGPPVLGGSATARDAATTNDTTLEASVVEADTTSYVGELDASAAVKFGGDYADASHCNYTVTLEDIRVELVTANGDLAASTVRDTMVEATVGSCPYAPQPASAQSYALSAATTTDRGFHAEYLAASGNQPKGTLVVDLTKSGAGFAAAATWHRTDIGKPFDWTVTATVAVAPAP